MKISRDEATEKWLFDEIRTNMGKEAREHIHLSDCLAPRKAFWQRVKPLPLTDDEIMYFSTGRGHEDVLLYISGYSHGKAKQWEGIWYTPDLFMNFPVEIKTRRRNLAEPGKEAEVYDYYLKQLKGYCAVENIQQGWLFVWCLVQKQEDKKTKPEMACYTIEFEPVELQFERERLLDTKIAIEGSIAGKDHSMIPQCPEWMCGQVNNIMIEKPACLTCKKEFDAEWRIKKHVESKTGKDHETKPGVYRQEYEKRCKWFDDCKPGGQDGV